MIQLIYTKHRQFATDIYTLEFNPEQVKFDVVQPRKRTGLTGIFSNWWKNRGYKLVGAINGSFFRYVPEASSVGLSWIYEGVLMSDTVADDEFLELIYDGALHVDDITAIDILDLYPNAKWALSMGNLLVKDGKKNLLKADRFSHTKHPNPRTMLGMKDKNVVLAVTDGRNPNDKGLTADQQAEFMLSIGCQLAINADGGGSSTMTIENKVVNEPSDGVQRKIANGLLVYIKGAYQIIRNDLTTPIKAPSDFYAVDTSGHAQTNFLFSEIACSCGDTYIPDCHKQRNLMQSLRDYYTNKYGQCRVIVDVWYRCKKCNDRLIDLYNAGLYPNKPSATSRHLWADACDSHVKVRANDSEQWRELSPNEVVEDAKRLGFNNVGKYDTFSHIGNSPNAYSEWDNRS